MSAVDALALIDSKIESLREGPMVLIGNEAGIGILTIIRNGLTAGPEWSEVQESNLRAQLASQVDAELAMAQMYGETIQGLEDALERARSVAVRLEQENAALTTGTARRVL